MRQRASIAAVGAKLGNDLTVLGNIDAGAPDPIYIVWHDKAWCPMVCKAFRFKSDAAREAKVLGALAHPNTPRVLGLDRHGNLLMEFLEGRTLAQMLDQAPRQRLSISDAMRVAIHIGAALHHVHEVGYLHLDVKPSNIMISPTGRPVLFDFGTARRMGAPRPKLICGTNLYIAPEECAKSRVGSAADVFALGVVIFEMLTGSLPFGESTHRQPFPQTNRALTLPHKLRPSIPPQLGSILASCLATNPAERPVLPALLPQLHEFVTTGPRMWPGGFEPKRGSGAGKPQYQGCSQFLREGREVFR